MVNRTATLFHLSPKSIVPKSPTSRQKVSLEWELWRFTTSRTVSMILASSTISTALVCIPHNAGRDIKIKYLQLPCRGLVRYGLNDKKRNLGHPQAQVPRFFGWSSHRSAQLINTFHRKKYVVTAMPVKIGKHLRAELINHWDGMYS